MGQRLKAKAVFFDLDGTLLDTAPDMVGAANALRLEQSLEPLSFELLRSQVSHGATALVRIAFPHAPEAEFRALRDRCRAGEFPIRDLPKHVVELRRRYILLSIPIENWLVP